MSTLAEKNPFRHKEPEAPSPVKENAAMLFALVVLLLAFLLGYFILR